MCTDNRKVIENTDYTIAIAPTRTRGLADLRIAARVTYDDPARAPRKMRIWTLKYDGTRYPMNPSIHPMNGEPPARTP